MDNPSIVESDAVSFNNGVHMTRPTDLPQPRLPSMNKPCNMGPSSVRSPRSHLSDRHSPNPVGPGCVVIRGSSNIHVGSNITLTSQRRSTQQRPEVTPAVRALFRCPVEASDRHLLVASRYLGHAWQDVARRLGFLAGELDEFEFKADSLREVAYRMLLAWREKVSAGATVENLAKALWDEHAYDVLFKLAEVPR